MFNLCSYLVRIKAGVRQGAVLQGDGLHLVIGQGHQLRLLRAVVAAAAAIGGVGRSSHCGRGKDVRKHIVD